MKRAILKFAALLFLLIPVFTVAQNSEVSKLFDKYSGEDGFTSVDVNAGLFELFAEIDSDDPEFEDFQNALKGLESLRLLAYTIEEGKGNVDEMKKFYSDIKSSVPFNEFKELMIIKDKDSNVNFYAKSEKQIVKEMVMIVEGPDEVVLLSLYGNLDLNYIGKLGSTMNMSGMKYLGNMNKNKEK
jgi:hypothetical protein